MTSVLSVGLFESSFLLYASFFVAVLFILLFIPSLLVTGAKPEGIGKAITCYLLKTFGLILVALSVVQIVYGMLTLNIPDVPALSAIVLVLVVGIGIMVHMSRVLRECVDDASEAVSRLVFCHTIEVIGILVAIISALSVVLSFIVRQRLVGWEMPATLILLGLFMAFTSSVAVNAQNARVAKKGKRK